MARPGSPLPHATNLRLSEVQYRHLVIRANLDGVTLSEAIRRCVERDIDATPGLGPDPAVPAPPDDSMAWRSFVSIPGLDLAAAIDELRQEHDEDAANAH